MRYLCLLIHICPQSSFTQSFFAGRRDARNYVMSREDVLREYGPHIREEGRVDPALALDMGDYMFLACFDTQEELEAFIKAVFAEV